MRKFLLIDTEDCREKVELTGPQLNAVIPVIKKINSSHGGYESLEGYETFLQLSPFPPEEITSINIQYHA